MHCDQGTASLTAGAHGAEETLMDFRKIAFSIGQNPKETRNLTLNLTYHCPDLIIIQCVYNIYKHIAPHKYALIM